MKQVIMAIDPGYSNIGWAVNQNNKLQGSGVINFKQEKVLSRVLEIYQEIDFLNVKYKPHILLIEDINLHFDRKIRGKVVNRQALQKYSLAWGIIYMYFQCNTMDIIFNIETVSLRAIRKERAQLIALKKYYPDRKRISTHEAEAVCWAMEYLIPQGGKT